MDSIKHTDDKLEFVNQLSVSARIFFFLLGLVPLLAPYELLIKPSWNGRINIIMLFFFVLSIGAVSVSVLLVSAALFGRSQHFQFDALNRIVIYRFKTVVHPFREERYEFSQIEAVQIKVNEWDSRPDTYDISMKIRDKNEMKFGDFASRQEAEHYLTILETIILI